MISRVTQQTVQRSTLANLQLNLATMAGTQAQMSSGKKISVPSDDPAAASDILRLRGEQRTQTQYVRNADDGTSWLTTIDTSITSSLSALSRARDLTVQSGDAALGATSREALAREVETVRDSLLAQANTTFLGRSVFAGTSNAGEAFTTVPATATDPATYTWTGTAGAAVERRVGAVTSVRVDSDGSAVFGNGTDSVFALLDQIAKDMRTPGADATTNLTAMDTRLEAMLSQVSAVGARTNQIASAQSDLATAKVTMATQLSGIEDIDLADTILRLQSQEVAYKGALGAAAKVLQPSLLDFLR